MHYSCVGVGVGPSNLSLACLMRSFPEISNIFFESKPCFSWHDGILLRDSSLQVSLFKDLVTLSDPTNAFSFLSYLHCHGKIYHFLNAQFSHVPRREFRNYMEWACQTNTNIVLGEQVLSIDYADTFYVKTSRRDVSADNIVLGVGREPYVPACADGRLGSTQFHVSDFVWKAGVLTGKRVAIIGGGQSGAEAFLELISRRCDELPAEVVWVSHRCNFLPLDDSPFTNDYFMPSYSDYFFGLNRELRNGLVKKHVLASDGVSEHTLRAIYQKAYTHCFVDGRRDLIRFLPNRTAARVERGPGGSWDLMIRHNDLGDREQLNLDVVIWATGYRAADMDFLLPIAHRLKREDDEYRINSDFAVIWDGPPNRQIFMQNAARNQRGLADPNLSLIAWRSQRILDRLRRIKTRQQQASLISWAPTAAEEHIGVEA